MGEQAMWDISREADELRKQVELMTSQADYFRSEIDRYRQALERIEKEAHGYQENLCDWCGSDTDFGGHIDNCPVIIAHQALHPEGETDG